MATRLLCEISNPSDPYTMECEDFRVGAVAVALLGNGHYGLRCEATGQSTPVLFGWDDWLKSEGIDIAAALNSRAEEIATALDSVRIGSAADRANEELAVLHMTPEGAKQYRAELHDRKRTSMNDIGGRAQKLAVALRERAEKQAAGE